MKINKTTILSILAISGIGAAIYFYNKRGWNEIYKRSS